MTVIDSAAPDADDQPADDDSDGRVSVGSRVRLRPGTDTESRGTVVEEFVENSGAAVDVGNRVIERPVAGPSSAMTQRWCSSTATKSTPKRANCD